MHSFVNLLSRHVVSRFHAGVVFATLLTSLPPAAMARTVSGEETTFVQNGEPLFPAGNINVFKQYLLELPRVQHQVGRSISFDVFGLGGYSFGGSLRGGLGGSEDPFTQDATLGFEVGICLGGSANYDLTFAPKVTLPDQYPWGLALPLTVSEGLDSQASFFQTSFPPLGKAYADLIVDLGVGVDAEACVFGCTNFGVTLNTCDVPLFKLSKRCDPFLEQRAFCALELASFNRDDTACIRVLDLTPPEDPILFAQWLNNPYIEKCPLDSGGVPFTANPTNDTLQVAGFANGDLVLVSSSGSLPGGLFPNKVYHVINQGSGTIKLSTRGGGQPIDLTNAGSGTHEIMVLEIDDDEAESGFSGTFGEISIGVPTITSNSSTSPNNTSKVLRSSGGGDLMGLGINIPAVLEAIIPPVIPPLSDSGSLGPIDWNYTFASMIVGPAIQLQTDFELTWDLEVTSISFTAPPNPAIPGSGGEPREVRLIRNGVKETVSSGLFTPASVGVVMHLTNCPPAPGSGGTHEPLPMIELIDEEPVVVGITYGLRPKLKAVVSTPFIGNLDYTALEAGASISEVGSLGFGPLIEGHHKFKLGEFEVYNGAPSEIGSTGSGNISFTMKAEGPPRFEWDPATAGIGGISHDWFLEQAGPVTNWRSIDPVLANQGPPGTGSHAIIPSCPLINFFPFCPEIGGGDTVEVASLQIAAGGDLGVINGADLVIQGGLLENNGTIGTLPFGPFDPENPPPPGWITLDTADAVLCGTGTIALREGGGLRAGAGGNASGFSLCNYNTIVGGGELMVVPPNAVQPYNLIHLWDFEGNTVDTVSGATGQLLNGAVLTGAGHSGSGLQLGNGSQTMAVDAVSLFNRAASQNQLSISYWQKLNSVTAGTAIYGESPSSLNSYPNYDPRGLLAHTPFSDSVMYFDTAGCCGPTTERINTAPLTGTDFTQWRHIVLVKDGNTKEIWLDGVKQVEGINTDPLPTDFTKLWIGSYINGAWPTNGTLDDVAIFGMPLDVSAISALAAGTRPDALPLSGAEGVDRIIHNIGTIRASGALLETSGTTIVNLGLLEARGEDSLLHSDGPTLSNQTGSKVISDGQETTDDAARPDVNLRFDSVEHSGLLHALDGGVITLGAPVGATSPSSWDAGQSFREDIGFFRAEGLGSKIVLNDVALNGGCLLTTRGGSLAVSGGTFSPSLTGSVLHIGGCNSPIYDERFRNATGPAILGTPQFESGLQMAVGGDAPAGWQLIPGTGPTIASFEPGVFFGAPYYVDLANTGGTGFFASAPRNWAFMIWDDMVITLANPIAGSNVDGVIYNVEFDVGAAVLKLDAEKTGASDGLLVEVLRGDNSVLESQVHQPGAWSGSPNMMPVTFAYTGDGTGDIRFRVRSSNPGSGHFGGTIDNLTVSPAVASEGSGQLVLTASGAPGLLQSACLDNHGTVSVNGPWEAHDSMLFANHGKIKVESGGILRILENQIATPGASAGAKLQPGTANASAGALVGGTWEVEGALLIDGANFTSLGANTVAARAAFGSINDLGIDPDGQADDRDLRDNPQNDLCNQLSNGAPAKVILRGPSASFPALTSLVVNQGNLEIDNHDLILAGDLINMGSALPEFNGQGRGSLTIRNSGMVSVAGKFTQRGEAHLTMESGAALLSSTGEFDVLGGSVTASADSDLFNLLPATGGKRIPTGTTIRVESPVVDSEESGSEGEAVPVSISLGAALTTIDAGGSLTIKGKLVPDTLTKGIHFPGLNALNTVGGTLRLEGDGAPFSPDLTLGNLTNTGTVAVLGRDSHLTTGTFTQTAGSIRIASEAQIDFGSGSTITSGEIVVEIDARPQNLPENAPGPISSPPDFNGKLVIDFTGDLVSSFVDVGDSWQIVPVGQTITGVPIGVDCAVSSQIECRLDGAPMPGGWLPPGSRLETFEFSDPLGGPSSGLGIRVAPLGGFQAYGDWAGLGGYDLSPFGDANANGEIDLQEFYFGLSGRSRSFAGLYQEAQMVFVANPETESGEDRFFEMSYVRPRPAGGPSPDANYIPYYSEDLRVWFVAPMLITDIAPGPEPDLERVTLRASAPSTGEKLFLRIQPDYNQDNFEPGLIPEKPLPWSGGFGGLHDPADPALFSQEALSREGVTITYGLRPGLALFFDISNADALGGSVFGTGDYRDQSALETAVIHAGVLSDGESGIVKVTFADPLATYTGSVQHGITSQTASESQPNALSYTIEPVMP